MTALSFDDTSRLPYQGGVVTRSAQTTQLFGDAAGWGLDRGRFFGLFPLPAVVEVEEAAILDADGSHG